MYNRLDYINKIKTDLGRELADSTLLIKMFDDTHNGFVNPSFTSGSTVLFRNASEMLGNNTEFSYGAHGTPITNDLCAAINLLERSHFTMITCSGLMALTSIFSCVLRPGDHALVVDSVYKPLREFCKIMLPQLNIHVDFFDPSNELSLKSLLRTTTKLVHLESPGSNTFEILDVKAICRYIKLRNSKCIISMDNSWATPLLFKPILHGVDISVNALTKYPSGMSDVIMGSVSTTKAISNVFFKFQRFTGIVANSYDCFVLLKTLKSTIVRLHYHHDIAIKICEYLNTVKHVSHILYPALLNSPYYKLWQRDYNLCNGTLSFVLNGCSIENCKRFLNNLKIFGLGWSWGGYKSLVSIVDLSHRSFVPSFNGPVIRLQLGFENVNDLIQDLKSSFELL